MNDGGPRTTLEQLVPGARATGIARSAAVEVVAVKWMGGDKAIRLTYRQDDGGIGEEIIRRDREPGIQLVQRGAQAFDGDAEAWRLAAEALRLRDAALFDPMLAVTTSSMDPLPHQLRAVYGELLPRSPLRFLLADDPGSGKTVMAGLYAKELMLRGDLARCLVVVPGSLVEQWQDELHDKFDLRFEVLSRSMVDDSLDTNVFERHPLLIARMDQLSRSADLLDALARSDWDLVVVDEAHRMSAHFYGEKLETTKRYDLGKLLGRVARHLLLMTATPHAGKQEDFQLFLALLDGDRFEGRLRAGAQAIDTDGLMRRMIKEELLTMDGRQLFPERRAYTVPYALSAAENELYEAVTQYVREEMDRAARLEKGRGNTVGFALTVLQRRLASSPAAILRSLERRHRRLARRRHDVEQPTDDIPADVLERTPREVDDRLDDLSADELERAESAVADAATAALTLAELDHEIRVLTDLEALARRVRSAGTDRKWAELSSLLTGHELIRGSGGPRKIIVFTEHRDTLSYLVERTEALLGRTDAVVAIHGGLDRDARRGVRERFVHDDRVRVLVATDAAGEGLNLQRAHLMVNYDLPWNPNRIEQRFGRIHRIGQGEVCHLWNLVAQDTREGDVFLTLLAKIEEQRKAYRGKVYDVLGEAFAEQPLRELLLDAIRYGDQPEVRERWRTVIDAKVGAGLSELIAERALHREVLAVGEVDTVRRRMEESRAVRLQPYCVEAFFVAAFARLGGRMSRRDPACYEITHVPGDIRDRDREINGGAPVVSRYARVTFEVGRRQAMDGVRAELLVPGHPLVNAVVDLTVERHRSTLKQGAVLVDRHDPGEEPRLLAGVTQTITDGHREPRTVSKRSEFVEIRPDGATRAGGSAPYLDYEPPSEKELDVIVDVTSAPWLAEGFEDVATTWAVEHRLEAHLREVEQRVLPAVERTRSQVRHRLRSEIEHWDARHATLLERVAAGQEVPIRPETAHARARELEDRLTRREEELAAEEYLTVPSPVIAGGALVVPQGLIDRRTGGYGVSLSVARRPSTEVRRRALDAVLAAERAMGRRPAESSLGHLGIDIQSERGDGDAFAIAVRSHVPGDELVFSRNEVLTAKNLGDDYRLALVSGDGCRADTVRYLPRPFDDDETEDFRVARITVNWVRAWARAVAPC